jgi:hypothetical protein
MTKGITILRAAKVPVTISGEWRVCSAHCRVWRGVASSVEPIVCALIVQVGPRTEWVISQSPKNSNLKVYLDLSNYLCGPNLRVSISIGLSECVCGTIAGPDYFPCIPEHEQVETGTLALVSHIVGQPSVSICALFLAERDVKYGRKGIWHPRPNVMEGIAPSLARVLTYGRSGSFSEEAPEDSFG